ncbi:cytochrome b5 domain-containing protein 1 isoform X2 [Cylas formicarius]|uniref:cytochrome b5 domain-containing protein 1 isoform X2 n=1 Tax=Cylas formicarius TaxID=197179 RepID=UPI002958A7A8|nr:cytochrome b5 domain-containing protein 1 isoform X2 [Cylas formicarius]
MENRQSRTWPVFAPFEVVIHNKPQDCWVSLLGKVLDITPLIKEHENEQSIKPLIAMAGKDISHWFDNKTGEIRHYVHPETGANVPYCPYGPLPDVAETLPTPTWRPLSETPWWKNDKFQIGLLSQRIRPIRIINMLTLTEVTINVCFEDTFHRILERYLMYNSDARSYTWRFQIFFVLSCVQVYE